MTSINTDNLIESLRKGFISNRISSDNTLMPSLLVNNYKKNKKILSAISEELETWDWPMRDSVPAWRAVLGRRKGNAQEPG